MRHLLLLCLLVSPNVHAQRLFVDGKEVEMPQPPVAPDPPAGAGAWTLRIDTAGGFTGAVVSVTLASDGQIDCGAVKCDAPVAARQLKPVATALASVGEPAWVNRMPMGIHTSSICSDCMRTIVTLKRREGDVVRTYVASWDDSQPPRPELRELRRLALELRAARIQR